MSRINKAVLAVVALMTLSLAANPSFAQNLTFDGPPNFLSGWTPLPPTCVSIRANLPGPPTLLPTSTPNFALLNNAGIRQCNLILGDDDNAAVGGDGIVIPATADPGLHLLVDLAFLSNEINTGMHFNDTAEVFLSVLPTTTAPGAPIGFSRSIRVASFSRNLLQPGGMGPLATGAVAGLGGFAAGFPFRTFFVPVAEFRGQRVYLTFKVRNAIDLLFSSALAVDSIRFGYYPDGGEQPIYPDPGLSPEPRLEN